MAAKKAGGATANVGKAFTAQMDAAALQRAQKIRENESRHKAALRHMKQKAGSVLSAEQIEKKAAAGLKAAFPKEAPLPPKEKC